MSEQSEALRLADALEQNALPTFIVEEAAADCAAAIRARGEK